MDLTDDEFRKLDHPALAAKGHALYREKIRPLVYPQHKGKMLIVDVDSGDYEVDADPAVAFGRLEERRPGCFTYGVRVGYKAAYSFGGRRIPEDEC